MPSFSAICSARSGFERPEKSISRFCGPRSIQGVRSLIGSTGSTVSSPGSVASLILLLPLSSHVAFLVLLPRPPDRERLGRDVLGDHRARTDPRVVADLHGRDERIVDAGPDVAPDRRPAFGLARLMREVDGDVARRD